MNDTVEFGVEQEHFALHDDGTPPSHAEADAWFARLCNHGYTRRAVDGVGRTLAVERTVDGKPLIVTNDSCTHIVEAAFPPLRNLTRFRDLYCDVFGTIASTLAEHGLRIVPGAVLEPPREVHWRPKETDVDGRRLKAFLQRPAIDHPLFQQTFPGCFAATHISHTVASADVYQHLPAYYAFEFLVPRFFSNGRTFQGMSAHCVRPLAWSANFHRPYPLLAVPVRIPESCTEYERARQASPLRDYSFVAVRSKQRLEFRSACSQNGVEEIIELIRFREAVERVVRSEFVVPPFDPATVFQTACLDSMELPLEWALNKLRPYWQPTAFSFSTFQPR